MKLRYVIIDRLHATGRDAPHVASWRGRCTYCGHRVGPPEHPDVVETRKRPWRIPSEIVGRYLAMKKGQAL